MQSDNINMLVNIAAGFIVYMIATFLPRVRKKPGPWINEPMLMVIIMLVTMEATELCQRAREIAREAAEMQQAQPDGIQETKP